MAARSLMNATISFGLVHVPVALHSATESKTVHFKEVHLDDGAQIEHRRFCTKEDKEVPYEEVVKGYEVSSGRFVVLEKDEVKAAAGERTRIIDVEHFVAAEDIDPVFYERTYYLGARKGGDDAYRTLLDALEKTGRAAIARFTFHNREYLAAIRPYDGILAMHTLRFADEIAGRGDIDVRSPSKAPSSKEVEMAGKLVDTLLTKFKASDYEDTYSAEVEALIKRKASGEEIDLDAEPEPDEAPDLSAALAASLEGR